MTAKDDEAIERLARVEERLVGYLERLGRGDLAEKLHRQEHADSGTVANQLERIDARLDQLMEALDPLADVPETAKNKGHPRSKPFTAREDKKRSQTPPVIE